MTKKVTQKIKRKSVAVWVWGYVRCDELILKKKKIQPAEKSSLRAVSSALIVSHPPPLTPLRSERGGREKGLRAWIREVLRLRKGGKKNMSMNGYGWGKGGHHLIDRFDRSYVFSFHLNTGRLKCVQIQTQYTRPQQNRRNGGDVRRD